MKFDITKISKNHDRQKFDCGVPELNEFLRVQARQADHRKLVSTNVLTDIEKPERILAFYSTCPCEIPTPKEAEGLHGKNYPHLVPYLRLSRLATDLSVRGKGLGLAALVAAATDAAHIDTITAIGGLIVDAKDEESAAFYRLYEFIEIDDSPLTFFLPIQDCYVLARDANTVIQPA